jgi:hypothetical protein
MNWSFDMRQQRKKKEVMIVKGRGRIELTCRDYCSVLALLWMLSCSWVKQLNLREVVL